jgi:hypothetical protein
MELHWSISPTFYERICANIHAQKQLKLKMKAQKSFAQNLGTKKPSVKCW